MHYTVKARNIRFEIERSAADDDAPFDPDAKVKLCFQILIAGSTERGNGVQNLWKRGFRSDQSQYADFGQYIDLITFRAFLSAIPFVWADKKYWYCDTEETPWEVLMPCLRSFNEQRKSLLVSYRATGKKVMSKSSLSNSTH